MASVIINLPTSLGEIIDKLTILEIKIERIIDAEKRKNCIREYEILTKVTEKHNLSYPGQKHKLKGVNEKLWELEDKIREKDVKEEFDDEFIRLARDVYRLNDKRAEIKKRINILGKSGIVEEKEYNISPRKE